MLSIEHFYLLFLIFFCFILQKKRPRSVGKNSTNGILEDSKFLIFNEVILSYFLAKASSFFSYKFSLILSSITIDISTYHPLLQLCILFVIIDAISFFTHYSAHRYSSLWKIHKLHHSILNLNPIATFRHSLLGHIYFYAMGAILTSFIHVSEGIRMATYFITITADVIQHTNVKLTIPYFLNYIFIFPDNHYYHHSKVKYKKYGQNFGLLLTIWDIMFGTFYLPKVKDTEIGLEKDDLPKSFIKRMLYPLI